VLNKLSTEKTILYFFLLKMLEGKGPLKRPKRRWEGNIKICLREIGRSDMDWIHLARVRDQWKAVVNTVMNIRVPETVRKCLNR
jgi:ribosome biogenesis protein Nip4